jgi:hypothetical protein
VLVVPRGFLAGFPFDSAPFRVLEALARLGFRHVRLLEEWVNALRGTTRASASAHGPRQLPLIPPLCPAVATLVESRFPSLIPHLGPWLSPAEAAGEEFPLAPVVLAAACPAQYAAATRGSLTGRLSVVSAARLAAALRPLLSSGGQAVPRREPVLSPGAFGEMPGQMPTPRVLTAHGPRHVLKALAVAEAGGLPGVEILDLFLCEAGCSGSPYLTTDASLSDLRWREYAAAAEGARSKADDTDTGAAAGVVHRARPYAQRLGVRLDPDMATALAALGRIDVLTRRLPGRDCCACGSPSCSAFAEDVILGRARGASCPHAEATI